MQLTRSMASPGRAVAPNLGDVQLTVGCIAPKEAARWQNKHARTGSSSGFHEITAFDGSGWRGVHVAGLFPNSFLSAIYLRNKLYDTMKDVLISVGQIQGAGSTCVTG